MNNTEKMLLSSIVSYFKCGNPNVVIIDESIVTINDDMGKPGLKVLVNPTVEATLFMLGKEGYTTMIAGIKLNEEFCFWDREKSSHNNVALQLGYGKNFIGFYIEPHFNGNIVTGAAIKITDFSGSGVYEPEAIVLNNVLKSKFMKSLFTLIDAKNNKI